MKDDNFPKFTAEQLVQAINAGGPTFASKLLHDSFDGILSKKIFRFLSLNRCFSPPYHSEDVKQETWLAVYNRLRRYNNGLIKTDIDNPFRWLYTISQNECKKHFKSCGSNGTSSLDEFINEKEALQINVSSFEIEFIQKQDAKLIWRLIQQLPPNYKQALELHYQGYQHEEIALLLGISVSLSRQNRLRAIKELIKSLKRYGGFNGNL